VPVNVDLVGTTRVWFRSGGRRRHSPPFCRHNSYSRKNKKSSSYSQNRKGGSAYQRPLGRHYESVVSVGRTERTLTTFSVDTILRIVRVRRVVPVVRTGKVVVPVNVDLVGTMRVWFRSRGHSLPFGRHNLENSKSKKSSSCRSDREGGSACQRPLGRHYESVVPIERTETTLTTFLSTQLLQ
jgi:hypothetical protein